MNCGPIVDPKSSMSNFAWAVLGQLAKGSVWDGDLVCKSGRDELVKLGLAKRDRRDPRGLAINELTPAGLQIAAHLQEDERGRAS